MSVDKDICPVCLEDNTAEPAPVFCKLCKTSLPSDRYRPGVQRDVAIVDYIADNAEAILVSILLVRPLSIEVHRRLRGLWRRMRKAKSVEELRSAATRAIEENIQDSNARQHVHDEISLVFDKLESEYSDR